jgi:opacity protein-like surface antigen
MRLRLLTVFALTAALLAADAAPARAQGFITPYVGFNGGGDSNCASLTNCEEKRLDWGVSLGKTSGGFGVEEDFAYSPQFFGKTAGASNAVLTLMSNLMLVLPAGPVQPYALVGLGLIRSHAQFDASSLTIDKNTLGYDIGGGINIFLLHSVGLRGDVRHLQTLQGVTLGILSSDKLDFWRASAGITFRF